MSKRDWLNRAKNFLCMILAVAMVFQTMPETAFAASSDTGSEIETAYEETVESEVTDVDAVVTDAETPESETEAVDETAAAEESAAVEDAEVLADQEEILTADEKIKYTVVSALAETDVTAKYNGQARFCYINADGQVILAENVANKLSLTYIDGNGFEQTKIDSLYAAKYEPELEGISYAWEKKGADGKFAAMAADTAPVTVGTYQLVITMESTVAELEKFTQEFVIEPQTINFSPIINTVRPGTAVQDITFEDYNNVDGTGFSYKADGTGDIVVNVKVTEAESGKELAATDKLVKGTSYTAVFAPAFTDKVSKEEQANYTFAELDAVAVNVSDLVPVKVEASTSSTTTFTYGTEVKAPVISSVKVTYEKTDADGNVVEEAITTTNDEITYGWFVYEADCVFDYDINSPYIYYQDQKWIALGEGEVPTNAGSYVYRVMYTPSGDNAKIFDTGYTAIRVVVEPKEYAIKAKLDEQVVTGTTVADVLSKVSPIFIYQGREATDITADVLGVCDYDDEYTNQYEAVFEIQKRSDKKYLEVSTNAVINLADGDNLSAIVKDSKYDYYWETITDNSYRLDKENNYRIRFKGTKAVFRDDGYYSYEVDVNTGLKTNNFVFAISEEVLNADAIEVVFSANAGSTIDVSKLYGVGDDGKTATGDSFDNPVEYVYTGSPIFDDELYANRALYKVAVVKSGSTIIAEGINDSISYVWQYRYDTGRFENGERVYEYRNEATGGNLVPVNAGDYRLHISYEDPTGANAPAGADVYFRILPKPVVVYPADAETVSFNAYAEKTVRDFLLGLGTVSYNICEVVEKDGEFSAGEAIEVDVYNYADTFTDDISYYSEYAYAVEKYDHNTKEWVVMTLDSEFVVGGTYRLTPRCLDSRISSVRDSFTGSYVVNYTDSVIVKTEENGKWVRTSKCLKDRYAMTINAKEIGSTEYEVVADPSKLSKNQMEYSGEAFDISADLANGLLTLTTRDKSVSADTIAAVVKDELQYKWWSVEDGDYVDEAVNAGDYYLCAVLPPSDEHKEIDLNGAEDYALDADGNPVMIRITKKTLTVTPVLDKDTQYEDGVYFAGQTPNEVIDYAALSFNGVVEKDLEYFEYKDYFCENGEYQWNPDTGRVEFTYHGFETGYAAYADSEHYFYDVSGNYVDFSLTGSMFNAVEVGNKDNVIWSDDVLRGVKTYKLVLNDWVSLDDIHQRNYDFKQSDVEVTFKTVRNVSGVESLDYWYHYNNYTDDYEYVIENAVFTDTADTTSLSHVINVVDAIKYNHAVQEITGTGEIDLAGNYTYFEIYAPAEYGVVPASAAYKEAIENVGGYVVEGGMGDSYIGVLLKATDAEGKPVSTSFKIVWEPNYTESFTVNFEKAVLEADLSKAVAPKSLKFNFASKKMFVGEEQELNVAITKKQMDDVICLKYESSDPTVLYVDEDAHATALKLGTVTVTATPCKIVNGEKVAIEGAKSASVKISVTNVKAPTIKKVDTYGNKIKLTYAPVLDGYSRTEIYVAAGKLTDAQFEEMIAGMTNENWREAGFAIAPVFRNDNRYGDKTRTVALTGLSPVTTYSVYVRNASIARTVNGSTSIVSCEYNNGAAGKVGSFTTTKIQLQSLDVKYGTNVSWNEVKSRYEVELMDGSFQLSVNGIFEAYPTDNRADNAAYDTFSYKLPLTAEQAANYMQPKLKFYVDSWLSHETDLTKEEITERTVNWGWTQYGKWLDSNGHTHYVFGPKTGAAAVSNTGVVTLKKLSEIQILVVDTVSGKYAWAYATPSYNNGEVNSRSAYITTKITSATPKKLAFGVGQAESVYSLFTYSNDAKVVQAAYPSDYALCGGIESKVKTIVGEGFVAIDDDEAVLAVEAGKAATIKVHDVVLGDLEAAVTTKKIDPVKSLKVSDINDQRAIVTFAYKTDVTNAMSFRVVLKNDRKEVIDSQLIDDGACIDWNAKKKTATYETSFYGLTQQSKYTVEVTAVMYTDTTFAESKVAKKAFKTTKLPASYNDLPAYPIVVNGGSRIYIPSLGNLAVNALPTNGHAIYAGNTYTLVADVENDRAREFASDTLIWTIKDSKIAKLKVNTGTYSATLTALRPGQTYIELKSKITGHVISRHTITVSPVGAAYNANRYYGANEAVRGEVGEFYGEDWSYLFNEDTDVLVPGASIQLTNDKYSNYYVFTAPAAGYYEFSATADNAKGSAFLNLSDRYGNPIAEGNYTSIKTGQSVKNLTAAEQNANGKGQFKAVRYFAKDATAYFVIDRTNISDDFTITVKEFEPDAVLTDKSTTVKFADGNEEFFFKYTAKEAGTYVVQTVSVNDTANVLVDFDITTGKVLGSTKYPIHEEGPAEYGQTSKTVVLSEGETIYVKAYEVDAKNPTTVGIKVEKMATVSVGTSDEYTISSNAPATLCFIPEESGIYTFTSLSVNSAAYADIKIAVDYDYNENPFTGRGNDDGNYDGFRYSTYLTANHNYYVTVTTEDTEECKFQLAIEKANDLTVNDSVTVANAKGIKSAYVLFTAEEDGYYSIYSENVKDAEVSANGITANYAYYYDYLPNWFNGTASNGTGGIGQFKFTTGFMYAGQQMLVRVDNEDLTKNNKYVVKAEKVKALTIGETVTVNINATDGNAADAVYTFVAPKTGYYIFQGADIKDAPAIDSWISISKGTYDDTSLDDVNAYDDNAGAEKQFKAVLHMQDGQRAIIRTNGVRVTEDPDPAKNSVAYELSVKAAPAVAVDESYEVKLANGEQKGIVTFTPPADGYYTFSTDTQNGTKNDISIVRRDGWDEYELSYKQAVSTNIVFTAELRADNVYAIYVSNVDTTEALPVTDLFVSVKETEKMDLTASQTVKFKKFETEKTYQFTAAEDGYYVIAAEIGKEDTNASIDVTVEGDGIQNYANASDNSKKYSELWYLEKGHTILVKTERTDEEAKKDVGSYTLSITRPNDISKADTVTLSSNEVKYYTFTAPKFGAYQIQTSDLLEGENKDKSAVGIADWFSAYNEYDEYVEVDDTISTSGMTFGTNVNEYVVLDENTEYTFAIYGNYTESKTGNSKVSVSVNASTPTDISGSASTELAKGVVNNAINWLTYTAPADGVYSLYSLSADGITPSDTDRTTPVVYNVYGIGDYALENTEVTTASPYSTNKAEKIYADEQMTLKKGDSLLIGVSRGASTAFVAGVEHFNTIDIKADTAVTLSLSSNVVGDAVKYQWYSFTADDANLYVFKASQEYKKPEERVNNAISRTVEYNICHADGTWDRNYTYVTGNGTDIFLDLTNKIQKDDKVFIKVENNGTRDKAVEFKVSITTPVNATETANISLSSNEIRYVKVAQPAKDIYATTFTAVSTNEANVYLSPNAYYTYINDAGVKKCYNTYLYDWGYGDIAPDSSLTVAPTKVRNDYVYRLTSDSSASANKINIVTNRPTEVIKSTTIVKSQNNNYYEFAIQEKGYYRITIVRNSSDVISEENVSVYLLGANSSFGSDFDEMMSTNTQNGVSGNAILELGYRSAGETVVVELNSTDDSTAPKNVTLKLEKAVQAYDDNGNMVTLQNEQKLGLTIVGTASENGTASYNVVPFTPAYSGTQSVKMVYARESRNTSTYGEYVYVCTEDPTGKTWNEIYEMSMAEAYGITIGYYDEANDVVGYETSTLNNQLMAGTTYYMVVPNTDTVNQANIEVSLISNRYE